MTGPSGPSSPFPSSPEPSARSHLLLSIVFTSTVASSSTLSSGSLESDLPGVVNTWKVALLAACDFADRRTSTGILGLERGDSDLGYQPLRDVACPQSGDAGNAYVLFGGG